jgi:hypothetical protein
MLNFINKKMILKNTNFFSITPKMSQKCVCLSPYECTPLGNKILKNTLSTHFLFSLDEVWIIQSINELKKFSGSSQLKNAFSRVSNKFDASVKIVIIGPLHESDMNDINDILIPKFGEIFYISLSENEIFIRDDKSNKLEIPGFTSFTVLPKPILNELCSHENFFFNEAKFKARKTSLVSQAFPESPQMDIGEVYRPFYFSKKRKAAPAPLEKGHTLAPLEKGHTPKQQKIVVEEEAPAVEKESDEIRIRFSGVPGECFICISPSFKFILTIENRLCFPIGTKIKFESPEGEPNIHSRKIYYGQKNNEVGLYDSKNSILYIYP